MKLNKKILRKLIIEEVKSDLNRKIWHQKMKDIRDLRSKLIKEGYTKRQLNENLASLFSGLGSRVGGLGFAEFLGPESQGIFGSEEGEASEIRTVGEQYLLDAIIQKIQLDPYTGAGLIIKNALEQVIRKYSRDELQSLFNGDECDGMAYKISKEVLMILEESAKERILKFALDSIGGELGAKFQTSNFTKGMYITINEKFSEAFSDLVNEEEKAKELADIICSTLSVDGMLGQAGDAFNRFKKSAVGELGKAFDRIGDAGPIGNFSF